MNEILCQTIYNHFYAVRDIFGSTLFDDAAPAKLSLPGWWVYGVRHSRSAPKRSFHRVAWLVVLVYGTRLPGARLNPTPTHTMISCGRGHCVCGSGLPWKRATHPSNRNKISEEFLLSSVETLSQLRSERRTHRRETVDTGQSRPKISYLSHPGCLKLQGI